MSDMLKVISPVDGRELVERPLASDADVDRALRRAKAAQGDWRNTPIETRADICTRAVDAFVSKTEEIAIELSWQMGRPSRYTPGEVRGYEERARHMIAIAKDSLADIQLEEKPGFVRFIRREPLGVALTLAAWNYPYLIAVNSVIPALMAGNAVILKHSSQTPLCAERIAESFAETGIPEGVFQFLHMSHGTTAKMIGDERVDFVAFTGSVEGGRQIHRAAADRFIAVGTELGGKDPAYVRPDAPLDYAVENLVDGSFFSSGQSCCGIERIYVHGDVYDRFVEKFVDLTKTYRLGDPIDPGTTLGPVIRTSAADFIRAQVAEAVASGARALIDESLFAEAREGTPYVAPQVLLNVDHSMRVMTEETFGPVVGIMKVESDEQAVELMNDSPYGLTASVWTEDLDVGLDIGHRIDTGTFFMNRCDYLDPALAWVGVKDSGRGCTLSTVGYEHLTRPKSFHMRTNTGS